MWNPIQAAGNKNLFGSSDIRMQIIQYIFKNNFSYDSLTIYDGDSSASPMLGEYCGTTIPPNHISSSNEMTIQFQTDGSVTKNGFMLEYNPQ